MPRIKKKGTGNGEQGTGNSGQTPTPHSPLPTAYGTENSDVHDEPLPPLDEVMDVAPALSPEHNYYHDFYVSLKLQFYPGTEEPIHHAADGTEVSAAIYHKNDAATNPGQGQGGDKADDTLTAADDEVLFTEFIVEDVSSEKPRKSRKSRVKSQES